MMDMDEAAARRFKDASEATRRLNPHIFGQAGIQVGGVPPGPKRESSFGDERMAEDAGEPADKVRRFVRVTSFRLKLADRRNLHDKVFVDALVAAGALVDDSPAWAEIEVDQEQVTEAHLERTEIEVWQL